MSKLDLSKLKKVAEDADTATFKHPDGHTVTVAVSKLSPKFRTDLDKIPLHQADPQGEVQSADPGDDSTQDAAPTETPTPEQITPERRAETAQMKSEASEGRVKPWQTSSKSDAQQSSPRNPASEEWNPEDAANNYVAYLNKFGGKQPIPASARDVAQTPEDKAAEDQRTAAAANYYASETAKFMNDLSNGHIDPPTYASAFGNKDTLGKIGTMFGLLISGMGSGLTHQPNAVMAMMKDELDKDLQAQQSSKDNAVKYANLPWPLGRTHTMGGALVHLQNTINNMPDSPNKRVALGWLPAVQRDFLNEMRNNIQSAAQSYARESDPNSAINKAKYRNYYELANVQNNPRWSKAVVGAVPEEEGKLEHVRAQRYMAREIFDQMRSKSFIAQHTSPEQVNNFIKTQANLMDIPEPFAASFLPGMKELNLPETMKVKAQNLERFFNKLEGGIAPNAGLLPGVINPPKPWQSLSQEPQQKPFKLGPKGWVNPEGKLVPENDPALMEYRKQTGR